MTTSLGSTRTSKVIKAPRDVVYRAFLDPAALVAWMPPGDMTGELASFDARVGGGYRMSLYYPAGETRRRGKTAANEDAVRVRFVELSSPERVVEAVTFQSDDPAFSGEMRMEVSFVAVASGTDVTIACTKIPPGIRPEDNDAGARSSLEKLARYVERSSTTS